jgi:hypothetical protein
MNQRTAIPLVAVMALTGVSGCGGSDDKTLSKREYIKRADAICAKDSKKLQAAGRKYGPKPTRKDLEQFVTDDFVPTIEDQLSRLRKLKAPKDDQDKLSKIYDEADQGVQTIKADPRRLIRGDPFKKANQQATAYGLKVCGS